MTTIGMNSALRYAHIDALRALAVLIVVLGHAGVSNMPGDAGVTIFFVISGFIITHILLRERESTGGFNVRKFYLRRALKLAPPFVLLIVAPTLAYSLWNAISWTAFLSQILFTYNWVQVLLPEVAWLILPGSNVTWSLAVEEQFYILFALIWMFFVGKKWWRPALATTACAAIVIANLIRFDLLSAADASVRILRGTDTRMDSIAWGILAALVYKMWRDQQHQRLLVWIGQPWTVAAAAALFLVSFAVPGEAFTLTLRYTIQSMIVAVTILYGFIATPGRISAIIGRVSASRVVTVIGLSSYSIYLVHDVLMHALQESTRFLPFALGKVTLIFVGVSAGIVSYYLIERPALKLKTRIERGGAVRDSEVSGGGPLP
ncbi:acyltransferase [Arthrobacter sp. BB-1]|uniref:acyltransferase family protein n=1 Tax=unclassified Arthrobacter TaxID=235627 RepID=UPI0011129DC1|nr:MULTISPECIES: acyltransferase [unclassified Arthrobacter]TNB70498.1 acyltransferase [Arthrobacter sp. BB-1]